MRLTDLAAIQRRFHTDRAWALYALGDLAPGYRERADRLHALLQFLRRPRGEMMGV